MSVATGSLSTDSDPHVHAFCDPCGPEIFRSVAYPTEVWMPDPMDVESIHAEARERFDELLRLVTRRDAAKVGKIQLMLGESGSGKTHLMRSLRTRTHSRGDGYFGYMQMTSLSGNYGRYVLQRLIDSLDKPYFTDPVHPDQTTGLMRLSTLLAESTRVSTADLELLHDDILPVGGPAGIALSITDSLVDDPRFADLNPDLITALLLLQSSQNAVRKRAIKYLRAESLSDYDRKHLGGLTPIDQDHDAIEMIVRLGKLIWATDRSALVLCFDQLEDIWDTTSSQFDPNVRFRNASTTLVQIASRLPNSIIVIACLDDFFQEVRGQLSQSALDRIEGEYPPTLTLTSNRTAEEARQLAEVHLRFLFEHEDLPAPVNGPTHPIPEAQFEFLKNKRTRDLLADLRDFRNSCIARQQVVDAAASEATRATSGNDGTQLEMLWNDFLSDEAYAPPDEDQQLAALFDASVALLAEELPTAHRLQSERQDCDVKVLAQCDGENAGNFYVRVCNRAATGGILGRKLDELLKLGSEDPGQATPILVRSTDYKPKSPGTKIAALFAELFKNGGRKVIVSDGDWRAMAAMQVFHKQYAQHAEYCSWRQHSRPLARLKSLRELLSLDDLAEATESTAASTSAAQESEPGDARPEDPAPVSKSEPSPAPNTQVVQSQERDRSLEALVPPKGKLRVGETRNRASHEVLLDLQMLKRHTGILGTSGSGKTTAALNLIEQVLCQKVPVLLIDRKGDLAAYSRSDAFQQELKDPRLNQRRQSLRQECEVVVYTPGNDCGRPIALPVAPAGMRSMTTNDRTTAAFQSAQSLAKMLGYNQRGQSGKRIAVMNQAIELLGRMSDERITIEHLIEYLGEQDDDLIAAIGVIDTKVVRGLLEDLQTLKITRKLLFTSDAEPLNGDSLFGVGAYGTPNKTRLTILNLAFLGGDENGLFWVSQLLLELSRWMRRKPSERLQALVMFDEADLYLPAVGKPPTKEPMEDLLKRARSAGLGVMLATQSPGDLDYKCRDNVSTWLLGKIAEKNAIGKMKNLLDSCRRDVSAELATQSVGQFLLASEGDVSAVMSDASVVSTHQLGHDEILSLAASSRKRGTVCPS